MVFKIDIYFKFECTLKIVRTIILKIVLSWKEQSFSLNSIRYLTWKWTLKYQGLIIFKYEVIDLRLFSALIMGISQKQWRPIKFELIIFRSKISKRANN